MSKIITVQDGNLVFNVLEEEGDANIQVGGGAINLDGTNGTINLGTDGNFVGTINLGTFVDITNDDGEGGNGQLTVFGAGSENVTFNHDDTDFNISGADTTDINITGITTIRSAATIELLESASVPSSTATYGHIWVRSDTPNILMFTDDSGTDFDVAGVGTIPTLQSVTDAGSTTDTGLLLLGGSFLGLNAVGDVEGTISGIDSVGLHGGLSQFTAVTAGITEIFFGMTIGVEGSILISEQASAATPVATVGELWIRSDTPNTLMFTDDAGTDFVLNNASTLATPLNLLGDINTATPPTTEAITALLQFRDLADDDTIGSIGYNAANDLIITNSMRGGTVQIEQVDAAGVTRPIIIGNADGGVDIYHPDASTGGVVRLRTIASGNVYLMADTNSDSANALLSFTHQSTTNLGSIGNTATEFIVRSDVPSKSITLIGERSTAANVDLAEFDPDNGAFIGAAQFTRLTTQLSGIVGIRSDANSDTENRLLSFQHQDSTVRAIIGHEATDEFVIRNQINSGNVLISAEDTGGTPRTILVGDPDAGVILYYTNNERLATLITGSVALRGDSSADATRKRLDFQHADGTLRGYVGINTDNFMYLHNEIDGTGVILTGNDSGGTPRTFFQANADNLTTVTADTELRFVSAAVEASRIQAAIVQTTDATVTEIIGIAVASGEGFGFEIHCMGTEDSTGDTVFERVFGAIRNQGGTTALVGSTVTDRTDDAGASAWAVTVAADDTADELTIDVTGEAATTIDWKIRVHLLNV